MGGYDHMTRIEEMKKDGYTLNIYGLDGQLYDSFKNVLYFVHFHTGLWIVYGIDEKEIARFDLKEYKEYSILTKNR
jgi:hypothetical protein